MSSATVLDRASLRDAAGEALCKARDQCTAPLWAEVVAQYFTGSQRTAQKYMRLARHFHLLQTKAPQALTSQEEAAKALTAIMKGDQPHPPTGGSKRKRRARGASFVEPGPFYQMAINVLQDVERQLSSAQPVTYYVRQAIAAVNRGTAALLKLAADTGSVLLEATAAGCVPPVVAEAATVANAPVAKETGPPDADHWKTALPADADGEDDTGCSFGGKGKQ